LEYLLLLGNRGDHAQSSLNAVIAPILNPFDPIELSYSHPIIDIHTHPVFMKDGRLRSEVNRLVKRSRSFGIERMVALGDVLVDGRSTMKPLGLFLGLRISFLDFAT
jgi:hypothetical protein